MRIVLFIMAAVAAYLIGSINPAIIEEYKRLLVKKEAEEEHRLENAKR